MKTLATAALLTLLLAGCQVNPSAHDVRSPYYVYPGSLRLTLLRPLEIPPESATVRLQFGRVVPRNGVEESEPFCIFELNTVSDAPQPVAPGTFIVTSVQRRVQTFAGMPAWPGHLMKARFIDDDGPSHLYFITEFRLRSEQQPGVRALACQSNQMAAGIHIMRHLTLAEIRHALGTYFRLDLPG